ncbi:MAG: hypothetical protein WC971_05700 [Coriobacteriia bacterium]
MDGCQDPLESLGQDIAHLLDGARLSLQNALVLLQAAAQVESSAESTASFLASMGAEEIGKAVLLKRRGHWLLYNAQIRLHTRMFADDPGWADGAKRLHDIPSWERFADRRGPLFAHAKKLQALREYYQDAHPQVIEATESKIVLASIDVFAGRSASQVRATIEDSIYVGLDGEMRWRSPVPCIRGIAGFVRAMEEAVGGLDAALEAEEKHTGSQLAYVRSMVEHHGFDAAEICPLSELPNKRVLTRSGSELD